MSKVPKLRPDIDALLTLAMKQGHATTTEFVILFIKQNHYELRSRNTDKFIRSGKRWTVGLELEKRILV